jgi:uracil-DNA glycosylase
LKNEISNCTICEIDLPLGPRPVVQINPNARILIAGQAPGTKVHQSGVPFDDASGKRLREWLGVSSQQFYDENKFAILPMGFCYPGKGTSGDLPPRPECAAHWRERVLAKLEDIELTLVIGQYAMTYHLPEYRKNVTKTVTNWKAFWPSIMPLPHPSPRNNRWLKNNPWFEKDCLPRLQSRVELIIKSKPYP